MQIVEYKEPTVERDMELTRELLLNLAADNRLNGAQWLRYKSAEELGVAGHSLEEIAYHLNLLIDEGFLVGNSKRQGIPLLHKMTWKGHELLDDIRDDTVWGNTKERLKGLSGVGTALMWELAKAELKKKLGLP
jgi:hypothetical protein